MLDTKSPFHAGELAAQKRAGVGDVAARVASFIRDHMPDQHRDFFQAQPFFVAASADQAGQIWTTIVEGEDGFVTSPDARTLAVKTELSPDDPLADTLASGADIGMIGIELATRRRNRLSGRTRPTDQGFAIGIRQSFGNCPKYISERDWWRAPASRQPEARHAQQLSAVQIAQIQAADTLFIGSGHHGPHGAVSDGFDASHRGGEPGFVCVTGPTTLRIPDYTGNNFFNTIGNLTNDPRIGLLFVDFPTGGLLHITGRARIDWAPQEARDPNILRVIEVEIDAVIERPAALSLRWSAQPSPSRQLKVAKKVVEAEDITSFYLVAADGEALASFEAGQHLPIALNSPEQGGKLRRTYSLSGRVGDETYRITVKRDPKGLASRYLHDRVEVGDLIESKAPAGEFVLPGGNGDLVLISAGVGLTPLLAMAHQASAQQHQRRIWFVHVTRNGHNHALRHEVDELVKNNPDLRQLTFYSAPAAEDRIGRDYDHHGRLSAADVIALGANQDATYMLCGPTGFMNDLKSGLEAAGVARNQIQYEAFGS